jgi:hypothetical protein
MAHGTLADLESVRRWCIKSDPIVAVRLLILAPRQEAEVCTSFSSASPKALISQRVRLHLWHRNLKAQEYRDSLSNVRFGA